MSGLGDAPASARSMSGKALETVTRALLRLIADQGLRPGDSLPNERDAMQLLGVSRASLRESLRLLEAHGMIKVKPGPGGGPVLRRADPETYAGSTTLMMHHLGVPFGDVIDARIAFEPQVAEVAARNRGDTQVDELWHTVETMSAATAEWPRFKEGYNSFHRTLAECSGNLVLLMSAVTYRTIWDAVQDELRVTQDDLSGTAHALERIAKAVAAQDEAAAREASRRYFLTSKAFMERNQPELLRRKVEWVGVR
jgi:GntR family transcriptional repressor for pyruvate dehydrogenase complex